jgi:hypothetical protein
MSWQKEKQWIKLLQILQYKIHKKYMRFFSTISISLLLILFINTQGYSQNIKGIITDNLNNPISDVTVVFQTIDSVFIEAVLSMDDGKFELTNKKANEGRILFQHISYHPLEKIIKDEIDLGQIILQEKLTELSEVYAKAERPLVKISAGKLIYNADMIMNRSIASNAFDIIKEIPGISENNDDIKLIGTSSLTIIMDGIASKIPQEQLLNILKSTPATQIKEIEIMYNAPSKYNVHGAVINIITDKSITDEKKIQGEITGKYTQMHYPGGNVIGNLQYLHLQVFMKVNFLKKIHGMLE